MNSSRPLRRFIHNLLILLLLATLILAPRPIAGKLYLLSANRSDVNGQHAWAAIAYTAAAQRLPWTPFLWEKAGDAYLQAKNFAKAEEAYLQARSLQVLSPKGTMHWGDAAFARGETSLALYL